MISLASSLNCKNVIENDYDIFLILFQNVPPKTEKCLDSPK